MSTATSPAPRYVGQWVTDTTPEGPLPAEALKRCVAGLDLLVTAVERVKAQPTLCRDGEPLQDATGCALDPTDPVWAAEEALVDREFERSFNL